MGSKICKGGIDDNPLVNFSISCVKINNSENITLDRIDGNREEEEKNTGDSKAVDTGGSLKRRRCCFI
jgi:hypothetical protein